MPARRIDALRLIGRITQQALEEEAAALGRLRSRSDALRAEGAALHANLQAQGQSRSLEAVAHLPPYLRAVRIEQARIERELAALQEEEHERERALHQRFRERKTYETALETAQAEERAEAQRQETAELDSFTLTRLGLRAASRLREAD